MWCRHCGKELSEDSTFCQYCGTKVIADSVEKEANTPTAAAEEPAPVPAAVLAESSVTVEPVKKKSKVGKVLSMLLIIALTIGLALCYLYSRAIQWQLGYYQGVTAYYEGDYLQAEQLLKDMTYKDGLYYSVMTEARQKRSLDEIRTTILLNDLDKPETQELILTNMDYARPFLQGEWNVTDPDSGAAYSFAVDKDGIISTDIPSHFRDENETYSPELQSGVIYLIKKASTNDENKKDSFEILRKYYALNSSDTLSRKYLGLKIVSENELSVTYFQEGKTLVFTRAVPWTD